MRAEQSNKTATTIHWIQSKFTDESTINKKGKGSGSKGYYVLEW